MLSLLDNETELNSIERNNNLFQRKCSNFAEQHHEICRSMQNLEACNSQVKRMASITKEKLLVAKSDVEKHQTETQKFVQTSTDLMISSTEKIELIRANDNASPRCADLSLSITLPFDNCIRAKTEEIEKLNSKLSEIARLDELLVSDREALEKLQQSTSKLKGKVEKEKLTLQEEHDRQTGIIAELETFTSENRKNIVDAERSNSLATKENLKLEAEIKEAEQIRDELLQKNKTIKSKIASDDLISKLDKLYSLLQMFDTESDVDTKFIRELEGCEEILHMFEELQKLKADAPIVSAHVSDSEAVATLEASLETVKKQSEDLNIDIEQMKNYSHTFSVNSEILTRKLSGIEAVKKQIEEHTITLGKLKVTENAAKPVNERSRSSRKEEVFRRLEATRNDIPGPEPYQPYKTPSQKARNSRKTLNSVNNISASVDTEQYNNKSSSVYPGIDMVGSQKNDFVKDNISSQDMSSSIDISDISTMSDDGNLQNVDGMNAMFGDLDNNVPEPPAAVDFSMMDHMAKYTERQSKASKETAVESQEQSPPDQIADSDEDDDLMAPDDDDDFDQSVWGDE